MLFGLYDGGGGVFEHDVVKLAAVDGSAWFSEPVYAYRALTFRCDSERKLLYMDLNLSIMKLCFMLHSSLVF